MRKGTSLAAVVCFLVCFAPALWAQDQKPAPAKGDQKEADKPEPRKEDLHSMLNQLDNVSRTLHTTEEAAIEADPALQAERQSLMDEVQQTVEKIRAYEQKVDDKVVEKSPDSKPLVQEKRDLVAKVEDETPGKKGATFGLGRLMRFLTGEKTPGHNKTDRRGKGAGHGKAGAAE